MDLNFSFKIYRLCCKKVALARKDNTDIVEWLPVNSSYGQLVTSKSCDELAVFSAWCDELTIVEHTCIHDDLKRVNLPILCITGAFKVLFMGDSQLHHMRKAATSWPFLTSYDKFTIFEYTSINLTVTTILNDYILVDFIQSQLVSRHTVNSSHSSSRPLPGSLQLRSPSTRQLSLLKGKTQKPRKYSTN